MLTFRHCSTCFLLFFLGVSPALGDGPEKEAAELRHILEIIERGAAQRESSSFWMKYDVREWRSSRLNERDFNESVKYDKGRQPPVGGFTDVDFVRHAELARKGQLLRTSHEGPELAGGRVTPREGTDISIFDGKVTKKFWRRTNSYAVSVDSKNVSKGAVVSPWYLCGESPLLKILQGWRDNKGEGKAGEVKKLSIREEQAKDGSPLVFIELRRANNRSVKAWLRKDFSYSIYRLENCRPDDQPAWRSDDWEYAEIDGVPYPKLGVLTFFFTDSGLASQEFRFKLTFLETNPAKIPADLFELEIPSRAVVQDLDAKTLLSDPTKIKERADRMAAQSAAQSESGTRTVVLTIVLVVLTALLSVLWWVYRRRARIETPDARNQ